MSVVTLPTLSDSRSAPVLATQAIEAVQAAWAVLATVPDPEVPALSVLALGIVRDVIQHPDGLEIVLTPT